MHFSIMTETVTQNVVGFFNHVKSVFFHNDFISQQGANVSPVVKGSHTERQISQNQFDDYMEDILELMQRYQEIMGHKNNDHFEQREFVLAKLQRQKEKLKRIIKLDCYQAHVITKQDCKRLLSTLRTIGLPNKRQKQKRLYGYETNTSEFLADPIALNKPKNTNENQLTQSFLSQSANSISPYLNIADLDGRNGFSIDGSGGKILNFTGRVATNRLGDINADGIDDFILCANGDLGTFNACLHDHRVSGSCFVLLGQPYFAPSMKLGDLDSLNGFYIRGVYGCDGLGTSVSSGDLNGDGMNDIVIGATAMYNTPNQTAGGAYIIFGKNTTSSGAFNKTFLLSALDGHNGIKIMGPINANDGSYKYNTGFSLTAEGDINGDGIDDLVIGTAFYKYGPIAKNNSTAGYVLFGKNTKRDGLFNASINLVELNEREGFMLLATAGYRNGYTVSTGDVNGDGINDIVIGAPSIAPSIDQYQAFIYVLFGKNTSYESLFFNNPTFLSDLNGTNGFTILEKNDSKVGQAMSSYGDINGDGFDDIVVSTNGLNVNNRSGCTTYVVYGKQTFENASFYLDNLDGYNGFYLEYDNCSYTEFSVNTNGDLNGDRIDDVFNGLNHNTEENKGQVYILFGKNSDKEKVFLTQESEVTSKQGVWINYTGWDAEYFGGKVSSVGDINHDGYDDLIIGMSVYFKTKSLLIPVAFVIFGGYYDYPSNNNSNLTTYLMGVGVVSAIIGVFAATLKAKLILKRWQNNPPLLIDAKTPVSKHEELSERQPLLSHHPSSSETNLYISDVAPSILCVENNSETDLFKRYGKEALSSDIHGQLDETKNLLIKAQKEDSKNQTLLQLAIRFGCVNTAKQLLQSGVDPNEAAPNTFKPIELVEIYQQAELKYQLQKAMLEFFSAQKKEAAFNKILREKTQFCYHLICAPLGEDILTIENQSSILFERKHALWFIHFRDSENVWQTQEVKNDEHTHQLDHILTSMLDNETVTTRVKQSEHTAILDQILFSFDRMLFTQDTTNSSREDIQHLMVDENELQDLILKLTKADLISKAINDIKSCMWALSKKDWKAISRFVKPLRKRLRTPYELLQFVQKTEDKFRNLLTRKNYHYADTMFGKINRLIAYIEKVKKKIPKHEVYDPLSQVLSSVIRIYENYVQHVMEAQTLNEKKRHIRPRASVWGANISYRNLISKAEDTLIHKSNSTDTCHGTHVVKAIGGIHFKIDPYAPGVEFMVNSLVSLITGHGVPPTTLLKINYQEQSYVYLASKTVKGMTLDFILHKHPELIKKIDSFNFSSMLILGLLINPQDAKADNYMVKFLVDEEGEVDRLYIIGIDNDIAFADEVVYARNDKHYVNVRNILYFFPQMEYEINEAFKKSFLKLSPEIIVITWLESLAKKNEEYIALHKQGVFTDNELKKLSLPIHLTPTLVERLYQRIKLIQNIIKTQPTITHNQLFEKVSPLLFKYYRNILKENSGPLEALFKLYRAPAAVEETLNPTTRIHDRRLLTQIAHEQAAIYDFEDKRTVSITNATEAFIQSIHFAQLSNEAQIELLGYLRELESIQHITLDHCTVLKEYSLIRLLQKRPNLTHLTLHHCDNVEKTTIKSLAKLYSKVGVLIEDKVKSKEVHHPMLFSRPSSSLTALPNHFRSEEIDNTEDDPAEQPHLSSLI